MISLQAVSKTFLSISAVKDVSFEVKKGEIVGFLGPNGAGKTTTMRMIAGYLRPTSGTVRIDEHDPITQRLSVLTHLGYLPENNPLYTEMKVNEYLSFIAELKGDAGWKQYSESVGLSEVENRPIEELSRGFRQRVGLAAALIGDPDILILDEPTSGLDPLEQEKIRTLIKEIGKKKTILLSTHILPEIEEVATRLIIINKGMIVYDGDKPKTKDGVSGLFKKLVS